MLKGLRKRETYDELINELEEDPIKKYPDRRASQIDNSNHMSQLASGFREVVEQNERLMKEKTKQLLLQDLASSSSLSHQHLIHSDHNSSLRGSSMFKSAPSVQFVDDPNDNPNDKQFLSDLSSHKAADEALRKKYGIPPPSLLEPIIGTTYEVERNFVEHTAQIAAEQERDRQMQQLRIESMREQTRAIVDRANDTSIVPLPPPALTEQASSSSSVPVRLALQDAAPQQQTFDTDEELIPDQPEFRPERLQPMEAELRHLFKPKKERASSAPPPKHDTIMHRDTFDEWNKERFDSTLKEQITKFRPSIKTTMSKTEWTRLTKPLAIALIMAYDKKHPK
jgi:hypothetical protein